MYSTLTFINYSEYVPVVVPDIYSTPVYSECVTRPVVSWSHHLLSAWITHTMAELRLLKNR